MVFLLPTLATLLSVLQFYFPFQKFPTKLAKKNLVFHIAFALMIAGEVWILQNYPLLPKETLLPIRPSFLTLEMNPLEEGLICLLFLDLVSYFWHRLNHRIPFLWNFHKFHHDATTLDPFAAYRFHPIEILFGFQIRALSIWLLGFSSQSVAIFILVFGATNLIQHSNLKIPRRFDSWIGSIFVLPSRHHVHHLSDVEFQNSNYSTIFIFWDKVFKSYREFNFSSSTVTSKLD